MISNPDGGCQLFVNIIGTVNIKKEIDYSEEIRFIIDLTFVLNRLSMGPQGSNEAIAV